MLQIPWKKPSFLVDFEYSYLIKDGIAGLTLLTVLIPQSMAYASLADLKPVIGLYSSLAVLPFAIFASNPTCTVGPFTVIQLLMRNVRPIYLSSFIGGFMQILISPFSSLISVWLLPKNFMMGFTTGCAFFIAVAQMDDFFGIPLLKPEQFVVVIKVFDLFRKFDKIHWPTFAVSTISLVSIYSLKWINGYVRNNRGWRKVWIPDVFIVCLIATVLSYSLDFKNLGIKIVGYIPKGFPDLNAPWDYDDVPGVSIGNLILQTLPVAIVSASITMSVLTQYKTEGTCIPQDMFLTGVSSVIISFFNGFMATGSLTRAALQKEVGAKTQISNLVMCVLLILVLVSIAPLFEPVPMATLAAIVVLAAKSLLMQIKSVGWPLIQEAQRRRKQGSEIELESEDSDDDLESPELPETPIEDIEMIPRLSHCIAEYEKNPYIQLIYFWLPCVAVFIFNVQTALIVGVSFVIVWKIWYSLTLWKNNRTS
eukprot:NODE_198_length_13236_cov_1.328385.p3 type:complete len:480 gc:universal NODE_198_length_13236_cov_1.328385:12178-10739(-)